MINPLIMPGALVSGTGNNIYSLIMQDSDGCIMLQKHQTLGDTRRYLHKGELAIVVGGYDDPRYLRMVYVFSSRTSGWAYPEDLNVIASGENAATREVVSSP